MYTIPLLKKKEEEEKKIFFYTLEMVVLNKFKDVITCLFFIWLFNQRDDLTLLALIVESKDAMWSWVYEHSIDNIWGLLYGFGT